MKHIYRSFVVVCMSAVLSASAQDAVRAADTYNAASGMLARGLNDLAAEEYEKFLESYGGHELAEQARYGLGVARSRLGDHEGVIEALEPLVGNRRFEYAVESSLLSARSMLVLKRPEDASRVLGQVVRRHGDHALVGQAAALYVESLSRAEELDECIRAYDEYEGLLSGAMRERAGYFAATAEYKQGNLREAVMRFGRLESASSALGGSARLMLARSLQQLGDLEAARSAYRNAKDKAEGMHGVEAGIGLVQVLIDLDRLDEAASELDGLPTTGLGDEASARIDLERGRLAVLKGEAAQAVRVLTRLDGRAPESLRDDTRYWLARAQSDSGDHDEAAMTLARALQDDPQSSLRPELMYQLGLALGNTGRHAEACQTLQALAREVEGDTLAGEALLAAASFAQRAGDTELAETLSNEAAGGLEGEAALDAAYLAAESAYKQENYRAAARSYARLLDDLPRSHRYVETVRYRLGMAQLKLGDAAAAAEVLEPLYESGSIDERFLPGLLAVGERAFAEERWEDAARWFERYVQLDSEKPSWDAAALRLGIAQTELGDRRGAMSAYRMLVTQRRGSTLAPRAWYEIGMLALSLDEQEEAVEALERAAAAGDERIAVNALQQLGTIADRVGEHTEAAAYFARAARYDEGGASAPISQAQALLAAGEHRQAAGVLGQLSTRNLDAVQRANVSALLTLANARAGEHESVVEASRPFASGGAELERLDPQLASAVLYERGRALTATESPSQAEDAFSMLIERYPTSSSVPNGRLEIAAIAMADGRYREAATQCNRILRDREDLGVAIVEQAIYRLGVCARELGDLEVAADVLAELAERTPADRLSASAALIVGESLLELGQMSMAAEMLEIAESSRIEEVVPVAMLRLGEANVSLQRWPAAEEVYSRFVERYSSDPRAYLAVFGRAWSLENQGRHDAAIEGYRAVIAQHDGETAARAQFQIGECLYAQKKYEEAVRELLRVDLVYAYPQWSAGALYEAGRCFEELDREVDALAQFEQVVDRFGDTQWAELAQRRLGRYQQSAQQIGQQGG